MGFLVQKELTNKKQIVGIQNFQIVHYLTISEGLFQTLPCLHSINKRDINKSDIHYPLLGTLLKPPSVHYALSSKTLNLIQTNLLSDIYLHKWGMQEHTYFFES